LIFAVGLAALRWGLSDQVCPSQFFFVSLMIGVGKYLKSTGLMCRKRQT